MKTFAVGCVTEVVQEEMKTISELFQPGPDPLSLASLTSFNFSETAMRLKNSAPVLWNIKTPENVTYILGMLSFCRSQHRNRLATLWAIHLKACGLSSRAFDALHATGLTMSVKWTSEAFKKISRRELESAQLAMQSRVCLWSYDNINIPKRVFSMRVDKENHFYSATAGTVWALPKSISVSPGINAEYQRTQRDGACEAFDGSRHRPSTAYYDFFSKAQHLSLLKGTGVRYLLRHHLFTRMET